MKIIRTEKIVKVIRDLCIKANQELSGEVLSELRSAYRREEGSRGKAILEAVIDNARIAKKEKLAICQDTGLACVFVEIGQDVRIAGDLKKAINKGIKEGYELGFLRRSVVRDPLLRGGSGCEPGIIHFDIVQGRGLRFTVLPKGFGCENKTKLKMFNPTAKISEIKEFIVDAVRSAGPDACPPYVVGVGIGGTADYACFLAKKSLLKKRDTQYSIRNTKIHQLEQELLCEINKLNIGPMGLGGKATALAVKIETYPTHIAGLPVCVNISCHALRSAQAAL